MRRYDLLDSLRGICACMLVFFHFKPNSHLVCSLFVRHSYLFVDFFFVLSGFVIFESYRDKLREGFGLGRFMLLRFGRLYPLHVFLLISFVAYEVAWWLWLSSYSSDPRPSFSGGTSLSALLANFLLFQSFGLIGSPSWNYPAWSIAAEFWTYVLFAIAIILTPQAYLRNVLILLAFLGFLCLLLIGDNEQANTDAAGVPRCIFGFAFGALLSVEKKRWRLQAWQSSSTEISVVIMTILFVSFASGTLAAIAAPFVFVVAVATFTEERGIISRLLLLAPLRRLGQLSYSIYMVHVLVIMITANIISVLEKSIRFPLTENVVVDGQSYKGIGVFAWQGDLAYVGELGLVIAASTWTFRFVEKPARSYSRYLVNKFGTLKSQSKLNTSNSVLVES